MTNVNKIKNDLKDNGLENIEDVCLLSGNLYLVKTSEDIYTYDTSTFSLEIVTGEDMNELVQPSCKLTKQEQNEYANENIALVHYVVKKFLSTSIDYDELESVGYLGFTKALNCYDKQKGIKFSTYAINCIINEILFFLRKEKKHQTFDISIHKPLQIDVKGNALTIEDTLEDTKFSEKGIDKNLLDDDTKKVVLKAINKLNEEEKYIMMYRYGLNGLKPKTQKELAEDLQMSQANISKIQRSCLKKLKFILQKEAIACGGIF